MNKKSYHLNQSLSKIPSVHRNQGRSFISVFTYQLVTSKLKRNHFSQNLFNKAAVQEIFTNITVK